MSKPLETMHNEGLVEPGLRAFVTNATDGVLTAIHFRPGDRVEEGQLLLQTSSDFHSARVEVARALVLRRRAELDRAWADAERVADLGERSLVSDLSLQDTAQSVALAEAALGEAIAVQSLAETHMEETRITAPIAGQIGRPEIDIGTYLRSRSGQALARIDQIDPVLVSFDPRYDDLLEMSAFGSDAIPGQLDRVMVRVTLPSGEPLQKPGRIVFADWALDAHGHVHVWAEIPNPDGILIPGWRVTVSLSGPDIGEPTPERTRTCDSEVF